MNTKYSLGLTAILGALAACGSAADERMVEAPTNESADASGNSYEASGTVAAVEPGSVTIDHGPVADLDWPAMTMAFAVPAGMATDGIAPGVPVRFSFEQVDAGYRLTAVDVQAAR